MLNFYQINEDSEIRTCDRLVIKALIPYQRTNSIQKLKLLGDVSRYDLYHSLTIIFTNFFWCPFFFTRIIFTYWSCALLCYYIIHGLYLARLIISPKLTNIKNSTQEICSSLTVRTHGTHILTALYFIRTPACRHGMRELSSLTEKLKLIGQISYVHVSRRNHLTLGHMGTTYQIFTLGPCI